MHVHVTIQGKAKGRLKPDIHVQMYMYMYTCMYRNFRDRLECMYNVHVHPLTLAPSLSSTHPSSLLLLSHSPSLPPTCTPLPLTLTLLPSYMCVYSSPTYPPSLLHVLLSHSLTLPPSLSSTYPSSLLVFHSPSFPPT